MSGPFLTTIPNGHKFGEVEGSATAKQLPDVPCQMAHLQGLKVNTGDVYYGGAGVTVPAGTTNTTSGIGLTAGDFSPWIPCTNLNQLYIIGASADDDISYHCIT